MERLVPRLRSSCSQRRGYADEAVGLVFVHRTHPEPPMPARVSNATATSLPRMRAISSSTSCSVVGCGCSYWGLTFVLFVLLTISSIAARSAAVQQEQAVHASIRLVEHIFHVADPLV